MELYDHKSEFYLLSFAFNNRDNLNDIVSTLSTTDFREEKNIAIFDALRKIYQIDQPVSIESVSDMLGDQVNKAGYLNYIIEISSAPFVYEYDYLKDIIKQKTFLRKIVDFCFQTNQEITRKENYEDFISSTTSKAYKLFDHLNNEDEEIHSVKQVLDKINIYDEALKKQEQSTKGLAITQDYIKSGFKDLDAVIDGLKSGNFIVLGARPGAGKTSLMMNIVDNLRDKTVLVCSLEMEEEELATKLLFLNAEIDAYKYNSGLISDTDIQNIYGMSQEICKRNLFIDDNPIMRPFELMGRARNIKAKHGLDIIFIDYLQLMKGDDKHYESNEVKIASISRSLKGIAKKLKVPIVALAQLNRKMEDRTEKVPVKSDLRESGSLEADADQIWLLYEDEKYENTLTPMLNIKVDKNRHGRRAIVNLNWNKKTGKMTDVYHE